VTSRRCATSTPRSPAASSSRSSARRGCGKTTLLRIVAGLETASSGAVLLDGRAVRGPGGDRGFVFQNDNLLPWRSVFDNAMIGPEVARRAGPAEKRRTRDLLKLVGLAGFEDYYPRQLSGGMRQRVNLARALAIDPQILLMDEPFSALDAQTREIMQTELMRIWEEGRKTVLFVTHQIDEAVFLSDRVLVLARRPGRIQETVTVDPAASAHPRGQAHTGVRRLCRPHLAADRGRCAGERDRGARVSGMWLAQQSAFAIHVRTRRGASL